MNYLHGGCLDQPTGKVLAYARTSSPKQKEDLVRQIERLKEYCATNFKHKELVLFTDNSSSSNWTRPGLVKLLTEIMSGNHRGSTLCVTVKDRFGRHCIGLLETICKHFEVDILYTEQDDEKSLDVMMTEELLQIVHLYSVRMYGIRSGNRKKLVPESTAIARGRELQAQGASSMTITRMLVSEGYKCENGKDITHAAVRNHIFDPKVTWKLQPASTETSAETFKKQYAVRVDKLNRIKIGEVYDYYLAWCKSEERLPVSKIKFSVVFNAEYEKGSLDTQHAWVGLAIKGETLHRKVREHGTNHRPETANERFKRFLESLGPYQGRLKDYQQLYFKFCETEKLESCGERELSRLMRNPAVKQIRKAGGHVYCVNGGV